MRRPSLVRPLLAALLGGLVGVGVAGVAVADAAQPTDYLSTVVSVTPATPAVDVRIVGGDAFVELTVASGHEAVVLGYQGEPYLRFDPDGTVRENVRSPAHVLNESRYGASTLPAGVDAEAEPEWHVVGHDGSWAWHDHRTHWMGATPPLGTSPGDQILDDVVPLLVDGAPVEVAVVSVWQHAPPWWPSIVALAVGALVAIAGVVLTTRRPGVRAALVVVAGVGACTVGLWQTWSLPSETGPPIAHWVLPVAAVLVATAGVVADRVRARRPFARWAGTMAASVVLVAWSIERRAVLHHAVLPTDAPFWLDRTVTAGVGGAALVVGIAAIAVVVLRPATLRAPTA